MMMKAVRARAIAPALGTVLASLAGVSGCSEQTAPLTAKVERADYEYQITVEGLLRAVETTVVSAPSQLERPARIVWLIGDGSRVEPGDLIARFDPTEMEGELDDGRSDLVRVDHRIRESQAKAQSRSEELETLREVAELEADVAARYQRRDEDLFSRRRDHRVANRWRACRREKEPRE